MRIWTLFLVLFGCQISQAANPLSKLEPFIDDSTFFCAYVNLPKSNWQKFSKLTSQLLVVNEYDRKEFQENLDRLEEILTTLKVEEIMLVYGATDFPYMPVLLIPHEPNRDPKLLLKTFGGLFVSGYVNEFATIRGFDCIGPKPALENLTKRKATVREDIQKCFKDLPEISQALIFCPAPSSRAIFESFAPTLPDVLDSRPTKILSQGIDSVRLWADTKRPFEMHLQVLCNNMETTNFLQAQLAKLLPILKQLPNPVNEEPLDKAQPALYKNLVKVLTPQVEDNRLSTKIDFEKDFLKMIKILNPQANAAEMRSSNNLKQIALGIHQYITVYDKFPTDVVDKKTGKPLLSWRVLILPYIEQNVLYQQFKLDEPWDSAHNLTLSNTLIKTYMHPLQKTKEKHYTIYLRPLGDGFAWHDPKKEGIMFNHFTDGTSNTVWLVESTDAVAVPWAKPDDLKIDPKNPAKDLRLTTSKRFILSFVDGSVRAISSGMTVEKLLPYFTRAGGEVIKD